VAKPWLLSTARQIGYPTRVAGGTAPSMVGWLQALRESGCFGISAGGYQLSRLNISLRVEACRPVLM
jgi:hypothetical protein